MAKLTELQEEFKGRVKSGDWVYINSHALYKGRVIKKTAEGVWIGGNRYRIDEFKGDDEFVPYHVIFDWNFYGG